MRKRMESRRPALKADDFQAGRGEFLGQDAAQTADADDAHVAVFRAGRHTYFSETFVESTAIGSRSTGLLIYGSA
jgi:hypothetical protein